MLLGRAYLGRKFCLLSSILYQGARICYCKFCLRTSQPLVVKSGTVWSPERGVIVRVIIGNFTKVTLRR